MTNGSQAGVRGSVARRTSAVATVASPVCEIRSPCRGESEGSLRPLQTLLAVVDGLLHIIIKVIVIVLLAYVVITRCTRV